MSKFFQAIERATKERGERRERQRLATAPELRPKQESRNVFSTPVSLVEKGAPLENGRESKQCIPKSRSFAPHLVSLLMPHSFASEQFRTISHQLEQLRRTDSRSVIAIVSAGMGDGKTSTAINLAAALAQGAYKVLLIDLDLRRPQISGYLGLDSHLPGMTEALTQTSCDLESFIVRDANLPFAVLPPGSLNEGSPFEILHSPRIGEIFAEVRQHYDFVIIDTPPLAPFSDCHLLERWIDGFAVVVAAHRTPRHLLQDALEGVDPQKLIGIIFNQDEHTGSQYAQYYAKYYSESPPKGSAVGKFSTLHEKFAHLVKRRRSRP